MRKYSILFFLFFSSLVLASEPVIFRSPNPFSSEMLFAKLDSVGKTGTWMEWDSAGVKDVELAKVLQRTVKPLNVWLLKNPGENPKLAVLSKKNSGEILSILDLPSFSTKPVPLKISKKLEKERVFRDYAEVGPGKFIHLDDSALKVLVSEHEIRFSYSKPDKQGIALIPDFDKLSRQEKENEIRTRKDFYAYEYSLMVRAFVASIRGLFNWQVWHWYDPAWIKGALIDDRAIEAIISSRDENKMVRIFYVRTSDGNEVEMSSNSNGLFVMTVKR
ncbi:MAG: hypothetical protein M0P13_00955 [Fibrobacteraceae bacterium]|nr:hypothetical protein [Fibrobacteraceae bacterium]